MVWATSAVPAGELSALSDDKPMLICQNLVNHSTVDSASSVIEWHDGAAAGAGTDSYVGDFTATGFPTYRVHDYSGVNQTYPLPNIDTNSYYLFYELGDFSSPYFSFDTIAFLNLDLSGITQHPTLPGTATVLVELGVDQAFSATIASFSFQRASGSSGLGRHMIYSSTRYEAQGEVGLRVRFSTSVSAASDPFTTTVSVPKIGEIVFGRRRQLARQPNRPRMRFSSSSMVHELHTDSGNSYRFTQREGGEAYGVSWSPSGTEPYSLDDRTTLDTAWIESKRGSRPFIWVPNPNADPHRFYLMKTPPGFSKDRLQTGVVMEQTTLQMQEQIPVYDVEQNG